MLSIHFMHYTRHNYCLYQVVIQLCGMFSDTLSTSPLSIVRIRITVYSSATYYKNNLVYVHHYGIMRMVKSVCYIISSYYKGYSSRREMYES